MTQLRANLPKRNLLSAGAFTSSKLRIHGIGRFARTEVFRGGGCSASHLDIELSGAHRSGVKDVTQILAAAQEGDASAAEQLLPLVYQELRALAAHKMAHEQPGHTLQATALVHEAWMRLLSPEEQLRFQNRAHFFGAAGEAMRRILIASARRKKRIKHGGQLERVDLDAVEVPLPMPEDELIALDEALDELAAVDAKAAEVVKLCFFVGLTQEETARELGVSLRTVERLWAFARAWLFDEVKQKLNSEA
jgi:RNA polymerase sigma factor (TIGR02999 family)